MMKLAAVGVGFFVVSVSVQAFVVPQASVSPTRCSATRMPAAETEPPASRVDFLRSAGAVATTAAAGVVLMPGASNADVFTDEVLGFKFDTPAGWERGDTQISGRRKIIVYTSPKNPGANAFVAYTPVRGDFTTLGSFGTLDEVSKTILPEAEGVASRLVDSYTVKNYYVYDYIVTQQGRPEKHIKTIWVLFPAEGQLATITAQCNQEDYGTLGKALDNIIASVTKT